MIFIFAEGFREMVKYTVSEKKLDSMKILRYPIKHKSCLEQRIRTELILEQLRPH